MSGSSLRDRHTQLATEPEEEREEVEENDNPDPDHYVAFGKARGGRRGELGLKLYYEDGEMIEVLYYTNMIRAVAYSSQILILMTADYIYTIIGNDIRPLLSLLREHKITYLQAFNEQIHPALTADNDEMVIHSISSETKSEWEERIANRGAIRNKQDA